MFHFPKKEKKLMRGLSADGLLKTKEDIFAQLSKAPEIHMVIFGQMFDKNLFKIATENFTDEQWQKLISFSNSKIGDKLKREQTEKGAMGRLLKLIAEDEFLKSYNVSVVELCYYGDNEFVAKVYLICGGYFLEGTLEDIVELIRDALKENGVNIKAFCPSCSSKNLRFANEYCLCNDCGALSIVEEGKVVKRYKQEDKRFWWANALGDIGLMGLTKGHEST